MKVLPMLFRSEVLLLKNDMMVSLGGELRLVLCRIFTVQLMVRNARLLTMTAVRVKPRVVVLHLLPAIFSNRVSSCMGLMLWA